MGFGNLLKSVKVKKGESGTAVQAVQQALKKSGGKIQVTGTYDKATENAVRDVQKRNKLRASGTMDAATAYVLEHGSLPDMRPYNLDSMKAALDAASNRPEADVAAALSAKATIDQLKAFVAHKPHGEFCVLGPDVDAAIEHFAAAQQLDLQLVTTRASLDQTVH